MKEIENFANKKNKNDATLIDNLKQHLFNSFKRNVNAKYFSDQGYLDSERIIITEFWNIKYTSEYNDRSDMTKYTFNFDHVSYNINNDIEKMLVQSQFVYWLGGECNKSDIRCFIIDFNNFGIFGKVEIKDNKILYSNSPVIAGVINDTKDDTIIEMIAKFTNVIATNDDKIAVIKKLSGIIDKKTENMIQPNNTLYNICQKHNKQFKKLLAPYDNFDFIVNKTTINHTEENNPELQTQELNITFDLGLSVLRYLENLNNL